MEEGTATRVAPAALGSSAIELLKRLIRADTVNPPGNERALQEELRGMLADAGFECELLAAEPERPNLVARLRGHGNGPTLTLLGHVDTVRADRDDWSRDPWGGELDDGWIWGRGALDMKGLHRPWQERLAAARR
jgi:acetylornithine deacetylase/succinyl-diaminopimelate desuccinylase-like protein